MNIDTDTQLLIALLSDINNVLAADRDKWKATASELSRKNSNLIRSYDQLREERDRTERNAAQSQSLARERIDSMMATIDELHEQIANLRAADEINVDTIMRLSATVIELTNRLTTELSGRT